MKMMNGPALLLLTPLLAVATPLLAVEEAQYRLVEQDGDFEARDYDTAIVAEVVVDEAFEDAGSRAFRALFKYIDGNNRGQQEIAMTAPVSQRQAAEGWAVSFMMPSSFTMETIPAPLDPEVRIREIPAYRAASLRYSGTWSEKRYAEHLEKLQNWLATKGLGTAGEAVWARYNAPFTPWFMRRNEILIPLQDRS